MLVAQDMINPEMSDTMQNQILTELQAIEESRHVKIIYACESGSRAWGFPSIDSDYDVRFIYVHPPNWYLSIEKGKEMIENPIHDDLDINGWDIRKTLGLLRKSNPPLFEWLASPIVYLEEKESMQLIHDLCPHVFSVPAGVYHYLGMAKTAYRKIEYSNQVRIKTYLYALRPLCAAKWILSKASPPPVPFQQLLSETDLDDGLRQQIEELLSQKVQSKESDEIPSVEALNVFIGTELKKYEQVQLEKHKQPDVERFNRVFRQIINMKL